MTEETNLCSTCFRMCKVRNENRLMKVVSCDGYVKGMNRLEQKVYQTELEV